MPDLWVARQRPRLGVLVKTPQGYAMIPVESRQGRTLVGKNQLSELIDAQLEKGGVPQEERSQARARIEKEHEDRIKVWEVRQEIQRRLHGGPKLMRKVGGRWTFQKDPEPIHIYLGGT